LVLHILPYPLPPHIHQSGHASELLADLVQNLLFARQPARSDSRFDRLDLGMPLAFHVC
jgi:hypothetical protein